MDLDRPALGRRVNELYAREHDALGVTDTLEVLDEARRWDLTATLAAGGVVTFAHVNVADCGLHVAAAVNAALDTGADTVIALGVLHAFTEEMETARRDVAAGGRPAHHATWGIQGPGIDFRDEWRNDHSLRSLRHFWEAEAARRGLRDRRLVERYPYLAGGSPESLPNFEEVAALAENAVIVATGDQFHHGIGYGTPPAEAHNLDDAGLAAATASIERGMRLLENGDYWGYNKHCVAAKSDDRDVGQLFAHLRGPLRGTLLAIGASDATQLYDALPPTWAAGGLIEFAPA